MMSAMFILGAFKEIVTHLIYYKKHLKNFVCCNFILSVSGVAGPLAAEGGGQICRPFVLGF